MEKYLSDEEIPSQQSPPKTTSRRKPQLHTDATQEPLESSKEVKKRVRKVKTPTQPSLELADDKLFVYFMRKKDGKKGQWTLKLGATNDVASYRKELDKTSDIELQTHAVIFCRTPELAQQIIAGFGAKSLRNGWCITKKEEVDEYIHSASTKEGCKSISEREAKTKNIAKLLS